MSLNLQTSRNRPCHLIIWQVAVLFMGGLCRFSVGSSLWGICIHPVRSCGSRCWLPFPGWLFPGMTHQLAEAVQANVLVSVAAVTFGAMRLSTPHLACRLSNALQFQTLTQNDNCKLRLWSSMSLSWLSSPGKQYPYVTLTWQCTLSSCRVLWFSSRRCSVRSSL